MRVHLIHQPVFIVCFLLLQKAALHAQTGIDLYQFDAPIAYFSEKQQTDSFLLYAGKKTGLARQADSLELWGWMQLHIHDFLVENNPEQALSRLDAAWQQRWREPANAAEGEPLLYIQANRGWLHFQAGRVWQSVQAYESAARWCERFRYPDLNAAEEIYKPLGTHYTRLGDNEKALAVFQKALALSGDREAIAGLHCNIGITQWNQGDYVASDSSLRQGLQMSGISASKRGLLLGALAQTQLDNGQVQQAYQTACESLRLLRSQPPNDMQTREYRAYSHRTAGLAATATGRYAEAAQLLSGALADAKAAFGGHSRDVGKIEIACSYLLQRQGQPLLALDAAHRALIAVLPGFKPQKHSDNPDPSIFYEENTLVEALEAKAAACELLYQKSGDPAWLMLGIECYDLAWQVEAKLRKVFQYSSSKLNLQKNARAREEAAMHLARQLFEKTGQSIWLEKAFAIAERSKAVLLLEALQDNLVRQRLAGRDARFGQITTLRQNLSYYEKKLLLEPTALNAPQWRTEADALTGQIVALERTLSAEYPILAISSVVAASSMPGTDDWAEGEALVEYFVGALSVDVFVFQQNKSAAWHRFPNDAASQTLTQRFLAYFENAAAILNDPAGYLQTAHALWQKIIPPEIAYANRLTIVPDGLLNFVPFEALVTTGPAPGVSLRNAPYLIRNQAVRYAWSLAVLRQQNRLQSSAENYLLALAPEFAHNERGLAPLRSGNREWRAAGFWGVETLTGPQANMQQFLKEAGQYRILHFSTHAFAGSTPRIELYDQSLFLPDIYVQLFHADLVVLSACQTGLGREQRGEGVMSLARAFAQSGAACIVSSLWAVNDRSTAELLSRFYGYVSEGETVCAALRKAKLAYLNDPKMSAAMQSPYFWAGLAAVGSDRVVGSNTSDILFWRVLSGILSVTFILILFQYFVKGGHFQCKNRLKQVGAK